MESEGKGGIGVCYSYEWIYQKCRALWNVFHCDLLIVSNSRAKLLLTGIRSKKKVEFVFAHSFCCCSCQAGKIIVQVMRGKKNLIGFSWLHLKYSSFFVGMFWPKFCAQCTLSIRRVWHLWAWPVAQTVLQRATVLAAFACHLAQCQGVEINVQANCFFIANFEVFRV